MSNFYFKFLKVVKEEISILKLFYLQCFQLLSYIYFILAIYTLFNYDDSLKNFIIILIFFFIGRGFSIHIRNSISEKTLVFKQKFSDRDRRKLFKEVEKALKKSQEFTKWSCGILATCVIFLSSQFFNYYLALIDKVTISEEELTEIANDFMEPNDLTFEFLTLLAIIIAFILFCYFILQFPTYYKRLVLKILTNCSYDNIDDFSNRTEQEKRKDFIQELFFFPRN